MDNYCFKKGESCNREYCKRTGMCEEFKEPVQKALTLREKQRKI
jgi:hypothetical protein